MLQAIGLLLASICRFFQTRRSALLENLALPQQLAVLKRRHPRPRLAAFDKLLLGTCAEVLVRLETGPHHRVRRSRHAITPGWSVNRKLSRNPFGTACESVTCLGTGVALAGSTSHSTPRLK